MLVSTIRLLDVCVCVCVRVCVCSKHQVFENATLASLLPTAAGEGSGKENAPSVPAEGGVKIKHTILPRAKDTFQADLPESALPATAHWYVHGCSQPNDQYWRLHNGLLKVLSLWSY